MPDIYSPSYLNSSRLPTYLRQTRALSGPMPRKNILDDIIGAEIGKSSTERWKQQQLQLQREQLATQAETAEAARKAGTTGAAIGAVTQLGGSYLLANALKTPAGGIGAKTTATGLAGAGTATPIRNALTSAIPPIREAYSSSLTSTAYPNGMGTGYVPPTAGYEAGYVGADIGAGAGGAGVPSVAGSTTMTPTAAGAGYEAGYVGADIGAGAGGAGAGQSAGWLSSAAPYLGPAAVGYAAPGILNTIHGDSTENIGHILGAGKLYGGEREASAVGSTLAGAAAGAAYGSIVPGVGTVIGGVVGGAAGFLSSFF